MAPSHLTHWSGELPAVRLCLSAAMQQRNQTLSEPLCGYSPTLPIVLLTFLHDVS